MKCEKGLQIAIPMVLCMLLVLPVSAALGVNWIIPDSGYNTGISGLVDMNGTDFPDNDEILVALNKSETAEIPGQFVSVFPGNVELTCVFDLTDKEAGKWNVTVTNITSGEKVISPVLFTIRNLPPVVNAIDPNERENNAPVYIHNLSGSSFRGPANVTLSLGSTIIDATNVTVYSSSRITCDLDITGATPGDWNVTVTNYDGQSDILENGFKIRNPKPIVASIDPTSGINDDICPIKNLAGSEFMPGANVTLRKAGQPDIPTINGPIVESNKILCFFDLNGAHVGDWDVVVTNLDSEPGVLPGGFTVLYPEKPDVTGIDPPTGVNTGNVTANITGSGFYPNATILLSRGAQDVTGSGGVISSGSIVGVTFDLSGMPADTWDLTVINDDGQFATKTDVFTISNPVPTISSIDPTSGVNNGLIVPSMNITGTGFYATPTVIFTKGATTFNADSVTWESSTRLSCAVNLAGKETGDYSVTVINPDSLSSAPFSKFTIENPAPTIISFAPSTGENTGLSDIILIHGTNFISGAGVNLTRVSHPTIPGDISGINATDISCRFDLAGSDAGAWTLEVTNPDGKNVQAVMPFTITNPPPEPTSIVPSIGENSDITAGAIIYGSGFLDDASVKLIKGTDTIQGTIVPPYTNVTTQTIPCVFNLNGAQIGPWDVVVTNTGDNLNGTLEDGFFVRYPAAPVITGISPQYGTNTGLFTISDISGTGFQTGATVNLTMSGQDTIPGTNVTVTPTQISADFDLNGKQTGDWNVIVSNDDGQSSPPFSKFTVEYPAPTVTNITPGKGNNNQVVSITDLSGTNFRTNATVRLNSTLGSDIPAVAGSVNVVSPTQITCSFDLIGQPVGDWNVIVTNDDGQSSPPFSKFTIEYPAPTVTAIDPVKASNDGVVVINSVTGTNFREGATVWLLKGNLYIEATGVHFLDAQTLNCTFNLNGATTGYWNVAVANPDQKYGTLPMGFEVLPPAAIPNFTAAPTYGTVPLTVQFTDTSLNNPEFYGWNFGDGTIVVGGPGTDAQNPVHTYNEVGTYNVSLLVKNKGAPEGNLLRKDYLIVVVRTPVANFTGAPTYGNAPLVVQFEDHSQGDPQSWVWNFGDGSTSRSQNPYHLYTKPGVYTVTLTVSNRAGGDSMTKTDYITVRSLPLADFTANRTSGTAPMTVQFTDTSKGNPVSWAWSFGDGTTSTEQNPVHTYSAIGTYSVQLTVTNEAGSDTKTSPGYIMTEEGMQASFTFTTSNPENLAPLTVAFTDTSSGFYQRISWNFGDGYVSSEKNPIHTYTKPGNYTVTQTISDSRYGSTASQTIQVMQRFAAGFSVEPETGSAPLTVTLTDTSIGTPIAWQWWILNEDESVLVYIPAGENREVYTIATPGNYSVMLDVTDSSGQIDVEKIDNCIHVLPFP